MSNDVALPDSFREKLRERILSLFAEFIPADKLDEMIQKEITAFFDVEQVLLVEETTVEVPNPHWKQGDWDGHRKRKVDMARIGSAMTPFRQLVWASLHQAIAPKITEMMAEEKDRLMAGIYEYLAGDGKTAVQESAAAMVENYSKQMASTMLIGTLQHAVLTSHTNMVESFRQAGFDVSRLPSQPQFVPNRV